MTDEKPQDALVRVRGILQALRGSLAKGEQGFAGQIADIVIALGSTSNVSRYHLIVQALLQSVIREVDKFVRIEIALRLASETSVSTEIVKVLAMDEIEVAEPILREYATLSEVDLSEIAIRSGHAHRLAISKRAHIGEIVSTALMCFGETDVVEALLQNTGARISERTFRGVFALAKSYPELREPLILRHDLPQSVAFEMLDWVTEAQRLFLCERIVSEPNALKRIIADAIDDPSLALSISDDIRGLIERRTSADGGWLDEEIVVIMKQLPAEKLDLGVAIASDYLRAPFVSLREVVHAGDIDGFLAICRVADISQAIIEAMVTQLFADRKERC